MCIRSLVAKLEPAQTWALPAGKFEPATEKERAPHSSMKAGTVVTLLPLCRHIKVPRGPGSPPVPVMHSPPRPLSVKDQQDWKIPPCISNWKNAKVGGGWGRGPQAAAQLLGGVFQSKTGGCLPAACRAWRIIVGHAKQGYP